MTMARTRTCVYSSPTWMQNSNCNSLVGTTVRTVYWSQCTLKNKFSRRVKNQILSLAQSINYWLTAEFLHNVFHKEGGVDPRQRLQEGWQYCAMYSYELLLEQYPRLAHAIQQKCWLRQVPPITIRIGIDYLTLPSNAYQMRDVRLLKAVDLEWVCLQNRIKLGGIGKMRKFRDLVDYGPIFQIILWVNFYLTGRCTLEPWRFHTMHMTVCNSPPSMTGSCSTRR